MPYIGLDVGTSGCKASVVNQDGEVLAYAHRDYSPVSPQPGYFEVDANSVWENVKLVLKQVARQDISALAIASFGEACVLLDGSDRVLANSIYYSDIRGSEEVADILSAIDPNEARAITGTAANPMYSANKLLWIKKHQSEILNKAQHTMLFGDYIGYMLTGERVIDYSLASRTMLFDIKRSCWSERLFDAFGLSSKGFSRPVRTGTVIGRPRASIVSELGLPEKLTVVAGGHDQVLAALGGGAAERFDSVDGMGSSECISLVISGDDVTPKMADYNFCSEPYVFPDSYLTLAFNASSGTSIRWFRDCFDARRAAEALQAGKSMYAIMESECGDKPTDLLFLPHIAGSGTPFLDSSMGGAVIGLNAATTQPQIYKSVLEGICFEMQYNVELLADCGLQLGEITAVGGGTRSKLLMQIKADVMNKPVHTLQVEETGTLGLALICAYAMGDISDLAASAKAASKRAKTYLPDLQNAVVYKQKMRQYREIYPALRRIYGNKT